MIQLDDSNKKSYKITVLMLKYLNDLFNEQLDIDH